MPPPFGHPNYDTEHKAGKKKKWTDDELEKMADEFENWWNNPYNVWFEDFALEKKIHPQRLSEWATQNDRFAEAMSHADAMQKSRLINGGLKKVFHHPMCALILHNKHDIKTQPMILNGNNETIDDYIKQGDGQSKDLVTVERNDK